MSIKKTIEYAAMCSREDRETEKFGVTIINRSGNLFLSTSIENHDKNAIDEKLKGVTDSTVDGLFIGWTRKFKGKKCSAMPDP